MGPRGLSEQTLRPLEKPIDEANVRNRVVSGMAVFSLVYPLFGHAREGRIGLQRPRKPLKKMSQFRSSLHRKAQTSAVVVSLGSL